MTIRAGESAPADGRWMSEESVTLWWAHTLKLERDVKILEDSIKRYKDLTSDMQLRLKDAVEDIGVLQLKVEWYKNTLDEKPDCNLSNILVWSSLGIVTGVVSSVLVFLYVQ